MLRFRAFKSYLNAEKYVCLGKYAPNSRDRRDACAHMFIGPVAELNEKLAAEASDPSNDLGEIVHTARDPKRIIWMSLGIQPTRLIAAPGYERDPLGLANLPHRFRCYFAQDAGTIACYYDAQQALKLPIETYTKEQLARQLQWFADMTLQNRNPKAKSPFEIERSTR